MINYLSNGKVMINLLTVGLIKKILLYKMSCFLEPYTRCKNRTKVELDLSNCKIKFNLKNWLSKLTSAVKMKLLKRLYMMNWLKKIKAIGTSGLVKNKSG